MAAAAAMPTDRLNYHHLRYFWVVAKEGGITKAASRLGSAVQTVSAQVKALERDLGFALFKPAGRGLALTEAGRAVLEQADRIFQLGEELPALARRASEGPVVRLTVGIADGLPKLIVRSLLEPALTEPSLRLMCLEGRFDDLIGELALHRLDIVLADRPARLHANVKVYGHEVAVSPVAIYAPPPLVDEARRGFPASLAEVPVVLPTPHVLVRYRLDHWFERIGVRPRIVAEFEDSALMKTLGADGLGVFPAATVVHDDLSARFAVTRVGICEGVDEHFFVIGSERRVQHPLVQRLLRRT